MGAMLVMFTSRCRLSEDNRKHVFHPLQFHEQAAIRKSTDLMRDLSRQAMSSLICD